MAELTERDLWFSPSQLMTGLKATAQYPFKNPGQTAELGLSLAPGSGEAMSLRDAWDASGRGALALGQGEWADAASNYGDFATALLGALPGAGIVARGTKRGAAWMDRNLPGGVNRLLDAMTPSDPKNTMNIFAGPTAKTADQAALAKAQEMKAAGASRDEIWWETGWDLDKADRIPRFEIDDSGAMMGMVPMVEGQLPAGLPWLRSGNMSDLLDHPDLYQAYPDLAKGSATISPAVTNSTYNRIGEGPSAWDAYTFRSKAINNPSVPLHEAEHGIQFREGFATGASPSEFADVDFQAVEDGQLFHILMTKHGLSPQEAAVKLETHTGRPLTEEALQIGMSEDAMMWPGSAREAYMRHAGEVEARNVQARMNMSAAERRATPPWTTEDVPEDQQIIRFR